MIQLTIAVSALVGIIVGYVIRSILARKERAPFTVEVRPYFEEYRDDGWIRDEHEMRIGYQYQLMIHGVPCFDPHVTIEKVVREDKIDPKKAKEALELAIKATESIVTLKAGPAAGLFRVGRPVTRALESKTA